MISWVGYLPWSALDLLRRDYSVVIILNICLKRLLYFSRAGCIFGTVWVVLDKNGVKWNYVIDENMGMVYLRPIY